MPLLAGGGPEGSTLNCYPANCTSLCVGQNENSQIHEHVKLEKERQKSIRRIVSCVKTFERWASSLFFETRNIEDIPPAELDVYLCKFWNTVTKQDGGKYGFDSLVTLRSGLERHLLSRGYQYKIRSSPLFYRSQVAFNFRKRK